MKRRYIHILIAVITLSVMALIGIQWYWVSNAIGLKEEEFTRSVNDVLTRVAEKLEKTEAIRKVRSHQQGRYLFIDSNADIKLDEAGNDTSYEYVMIKQFSREGEDVEVRITEERDGERITQVTHSTEGVGIDSLLSGSESLLEFSFENREEGDPYLAVEQPQLELDSLLRERVAEKRAFVGDIVKSLMEIDLRTPIEQRLLEADIDSILRLELQSNGIFADYSYGVFDYRGQLRFAPPTVHEAALKAGGMPQLESSEYQTRLYPHDVVRDPYFLKVYFPQKTGYFLRASWMVLASSLLIIAAIIYIFYYNVRTIISQKRNSEIKNDFINNMTHELKTPISTISLACEALKDSDLNQDQVLVDRYLQMINDENKRLGLLVEEVLQSAVLDRGDFTMKLEKVHVHDLITEVIDKIGIQVREKGGTLQADINADHDVVLADRVHLSNVIYNLVDNANKYSKNRPEITIRTRMEKGMLTISVVDKGIGISKEDQKRVFDKLYRVPTGNVHDVKGFGLGLSYVKIIVERLGGYMALASQLGKGSTFTVHIPVHEKIQITAG